MLKNKKEQMKIEKQMKIRRIRTIIKVTAVGIKIARMKCIYLYGTCDQAPQKQMEP